MSFSKTEIDALLATGREFIANWVIALNRWQLCDPSRTSRIAAGVPVLVDQHETELNLAVAMIVPDARELVVSAHFPPRASMIAAIVGSLGISGSKGRACSRAIVVSIRRTVAA
jgi:hypothetical protein